MRAQQRETKLSEMRSDVDVRSTALLIAALAWRLRAATRVGVRAQYRTLSPWRFGAVSYWDYMANPLSLRIHWYIENRSDLLPHITYFGDVSHTPELCTNTYGTVHAVATCRGRSCGREGSRNASGLSIQYDVRARTRTYDHAGDIRPSEAPTLMRFSKLLAKGIEGIHHPTFLQTSTCARSLPLETSISTRSKVSGSSYRSSA